MGVYRPYQEDAQPSVCCNVFRVHTIISTAVFPPLRPFTSPFNREKMSQTPASTSSNSTYQSIFDNALEAYKNKTKKDLRSHPLFAKLEACNSPDAVLTTLRDQIPQLDQSRSIDDKLTKWLNPTVNVIYNFSQVIGGGASLVSPNGRGLTCPRPDVHCYAGIPTCGSHLHWDRRPSFCECHLWFVYVGLSDIRRFYWALAGG